MGDWKEVHLPSNVELNDAEKDELTKKIEAALREVLGSEPEDIMIEYLQVMILNSKNFAEISESMVELLEEADGAKICEMVAKEVKLLMEKHEKQASEGVKEGKEEEKSSSAGAAAQGDQGGGAAAKEGEKGEKEEEEDEQDDEDVAPAAGFRLIKPRKRRQPEQIALASAYKMYLHSGFAGAFQEYQDYLQGVPLKVNLR